MLKTGDGQCGRQNKTGIGILSKKQKCFRVFFGIKLPEIDLDAPSLLEVFIKYRSIFDVYDSVAAFKEASGRGKQGMMLAINSGMATYLEGKIISFNDVNYDYQEPDIIELD